MSDPTLQLLPWVRRGGSLELPPDVAAGHPASRVSTTAEVTINQGARASVEVRLQGPGDVTGIAPQQVIRTDPAPNARTFEPNYHALVEFDEPSLPWLFTPASASSGRLRPWICLVVVRAQSGVQLTPPTRGTLPVLRIGPPALPETELPDLADSWAWAHAQVALEGAVSADSLAAALGGDPARNLSRLVSGRLLDPQAEYLACVVPTFEAGRLAGLGDDPGDAEGPAWRLAGGMPAVELPVYYHWRFATGPAGDFQSLALAIRGRPVADTFGTRPVDLSTAGLGIPGTDDAQLLLGGALLALDAPAHTWSDPALAGAFAAALASVVNAPDDAPAGDPLLAPPRYGSAYRTPPALDPTAGGRWYEQLNVNPATRIAAALGTQVVQRQQETLMAAAWDQAADLRAASRLAGLADVGRLLADSIHRRHLKALPPHEGVFVLAPLRARLAGQLFLAPELPRVARSRGAAIRRVTRTGGARRTVDLASAMVPSAVLRRTTAPRGGINTFEAVGGVLVPPSSLAWAQVRPEAVRDAPPRPAFVIGPLPPALRPRPRPRPLLRDSEQARTFRAVAASHLARFLGPPQPSRRPRAAFAFGALFDAAIELTTPATTFAAGMRAVLSGPTPSPTFAPRFGTPMSRALVELGEHWLLPGLDGVPANTALALRTNSGFVEAFLVGLNHEFGSELLWREFPAPLTATFFDRFWDAAIAPDQPADIPPLATWADRPLGAASGSGERFVLFLRSELMRRFPDAVVSAMRPGPPAEHLLPVFTGSIEPDATFYGFTVPLESAEDWSVVIAEQPGAPRFGHEVGAAPAGVSHSPAPDATAAHLAARLRQLPARITIPVSVLMREPTP